MRTMVDKIAVIIDPSEFPGLPGHQQGECLFCDENREHARELAVTILRAIREPSIKVIKDGRYAAEEGLEVTVCFRDARDIWQAMIDAAIAEHLERV